MAGRAAICNFCQANTALLPALIKSKPLKNQSRQGFWELPPSLLLKKPSPGLLPLGYCNSTELTSADALQY